MTDTKPKPVFTVFPGSFHPHECLQPLLSELKARGYETKSKTLPSTGSATAAIQDDVDMMRGILLPLIEQGHEVVLVLHSYAGFPGSVAIENLSKSKRQANGSTGGLIGVVYMCAFIPQTGISLIDMLGGKWLDWLVPDKDNVFLHAQDPIPIFYNDCPPDQAAAVAKTLKGHSLVCLTEKAPPVFYGQYNDRRAYVRCLEDAALLPPVQDGLMAGSGSEWIVKDIAAGHSPFMSKPKDLVTIFEGLVDEFRKAT